MGNIKLTLKYIKQYKWKNIFTMIKNNKLPPKICTQTCNGKIVVITGATSGIGYYTARKYASMGAQLIFINRNEEKSANLCKELKSEFNIKCEYKIADLSLLKDIFEVGNYLKNLDNKIDILIHNAGIYQTKKEITIDGFEKVFLVNYLSSFIINYLLIDKFKKQNFGRIIFVNSEGHRFAVFGIHLEDLNFEKHMYSGLKSYGTSKTAQLLSMIEFDKNF